MTSEMNQRELKFRAWNKHDIEKGEPIKFIQFFDEEAGEMMMCMEDDKEFHYPFGIVFHDPSWIVEQYTGLKDKNSTEIYEGDLVSFYYKSPNESKAGNVVCEIIFEEGMFCLKWADGYKNAARLNPSKYEVVGNIYKSAAAPR